MSSTENGKSINETRDSDASSDHDTRGGIKFGTAVAYDDAYNGNGNTSNNTEYVDALPTLEEERRLLGEDDDDISDLKKRERLEEEDTGRIGSGDMGASHPSSNTSWQKQKVRFFPVEFEYVECNSNCFFCML